MSTSLRRRQNVFSGKLMTEQYSDPSGTLAVFACKLQGHGKRYGQDHANQTEQTSPKNQRKEDNQRGQAKPAPHKSRFEEIAKQKINNQISGSCERGGTCSELDKGEKDCWNCGDNEADIGHIVQQKGQEAPKNGKSTPRMDSHNQIRTPMARLISVLMTI